MAEVLRVTQVEPGSAFYSVPANQASQFIKLAQKEKIAYKTVIGKPDTFTFKSRSLFERKPDSFDVISEGGQDSTSQRAKQQFIERIEAQKPQTQDRVSSSSMLTPIEQAKRTTTQFQPQVQEQRQTRVYGDSDVRRIPIPQQTVDIRDIPQPIPALNRVSAISYLQHDVIESKPGLVQQGPFIRFLGQEKTKKDIIITDQPLTRVESEAIRSGKKQIPIYEEAPSFSKTPLRALENKKIATVAQVEQSERALGVTSPEQALIKKAQGFELSKTAKEASAIGFGVLAAQVATAPPRAAVKVLSPQTFKTEILGSGKITELTVPGTKVSTDVESKGLFTQGLRRGSFKARTVSTAEIKDAYPTSYQLDTQGTLKERQNILSRIARQPVFKETEFGMAARQENLGKMVVESPTGLRSNLRVYRSIGLPEQRGGTIIKENVVFPKTGVKYDFGAVSEIGNKRFQTTSNMFYSYKDLSAPKEEVFIGESVGQTTKPPVTLTKLTQPTINKQTAVIAQVIGPATKSINSPMKFTFGSTAALESTRITSPQKQRTTSFSLTKPSTTQQLFTLPSTKKDTGSISKGGTAIFSGLVSGSLTGVSSKTSSLSRSGQREQQIQQKESLIKQKDLSLERTASSFRSTFKQLNIQKQREKEQERIRQSEYFSLPFTLGRGRFGFGTPSKPPEGFLNIRRKTKGVKFSSNSRKGYTPSLIGFFSGKRIFRAPNIESGIGVRYPVEFFGKRRK